MSMMCFLSFDLSPTRVVEDLREKYTHLARCPGSLRGLVFPQRGSATIRTPLVSKYVSNREKHTLRHEMACKANLFQWYFPRESRTTINEKPVFLFLPEN